MTSKYDAQLYIANSMITVSKLVTSGIAAGWRGAGIVLLRTFGSIHPRTGCLASVTFSPGDRFKACAATGADGTAHGAGYASLCCLRAGDGHASRAIGSAGERLVHTEEVTGSIPVSPTSRACLVGALRAPSPRAAVFARGRAPGPPRRWLR
jgi:hypothetical protein